MRREESPVVSVDEVFAVSQYVRWVGLVSVDGKVILSKMRSGLKSASPQEFDEEFLKLGPLTLLGVAEKYCPHLEQLEAIVACYGLMTHVHARLDSQVIVVSIENREDALLDVRNWLREKKALLRGW
jgi:hypothetical protein